MERNLPATLVVAILAASAAAATVPLVAFDFAGASQDEGRAPSRDGLVEFMLDEGVKVVKGGPTGKPYLLFDGTPQSTVRVNASRLGKRLAGDEIAASFWVRVDAAREGKALFGLAVGDGGAEAPLSISIPTKKTDFDPYNLYTRAFEDNTPTGVWHHVAFSYSMSNLNYRIWFNGRLQREHNLVVDQSAPVVDLFALPIAKGFAGALADIRVWNARIPDEELLRMETSQPAAAAMAAAFDAARKDAPPGAFADWCAAQAAAARGFGPTCRVRDWMRVQEALCALPRLAAWVRAAARDPAASAFAKAPVLPIRIYPYSIDKRLPWLLPADGRVVGEVKVSAAPGEYESASAMFFPYRAVKGFLLTPGDLSGPGGARIPAAEVDVKVVKVWYTYGSGWNSYFGGGREYPVQTPELILHDDALIRTVDGLRKNYLRLSYPTGERYVDISRFGTPESIPSVNIYKEPVYDAKTLQPLDLEAGALRQYWVTVHVPPGTPPGTYSGRLALSEEGRPAGALPFAVEVHPFTLPKAATRYNIDKRFYGTWMENTISLSSKLQWNIFQGGPIGMTSYSNACARLLNEYRNMAAHNMLNPWTVSFNDANNPDIEERQIDLMIEAGLETRPLFGNLPSYEGEWCAGIPRNAKDYPNRDVSIEALPHLYHQSMANYSNIVKRAMEMVERKLGHRDVFCYGLEEAGPGTVRREMPFFATLRHYGGKPFISMCHAKWVSFAVCADDTPASIDRNNAQLWHEGGAETTTYAAPFSGPSNPVLWRRNKGIRLYMANYDGCNEYCFCTGTDVWNEFCYNSRYGVFSIAFHAADGILETVQWEALREGFDDVRYLTLLRRLARAAMRSGKPRLVRLGRLTYAWAEGIDQESVDLDEMRAGTVERILRLRDALAADGIETAGFSAY